jgi:hypothetical protein
MFRRALITGSMSAVIAVLALGGYALGASSKSDAGSWIGNAVTGQMLVHLLHSQIMHTLTQQGFTRSSLHAHCVYRAYRPTNTGVTHFARALKLTCTVSQQVTGGS